MTAKKIPVFSSQGKTLFILVLFCFLAVFFIRLRLVNVYTPNIGGIEQNVIFSIQTLASGDPLYSDPEKPLYSITQYSPLYFYMVAGTGNLLGYDAAEPILWYRLSRLFSLIFNLLLLIIIYKSLRTFVPDRKLPAAGLSLLLFLFFEQQDYSRPDSLYHLFFGISVYFYIKLLYSTHKVKNLVFLGISVAISLFSKQSAVYLCFLLFVLLIFAPVFLKKIHWVLLPFFVSLIVLNFLFLDASIEIIIKNLYIGILNGMDIKWAIRQFYLPSFPRFILFFLAMMLLLLFRKKIMSPVIHFIIIASLYYFGISILSGMKWGSGTNYFFEFCFLVIPGIFLLIDFALKSNIDTMLLNKIGIAIIISMVIPQIMIIAWRDYYKSDKLSYLRAKETFILIEKQPWYNTDTRFVIPERKWLANFFYNKTLFAQPDIYKTLWGSEAKSSLLDPKNQPLPANICIIKSNNNLPDSIFNIKLQNYFPVLVYDKYIVFRSETQP